METTIITCPNCGFNKQIPFASLPKSRVNVTCRSCQHSFSWEPKITVPFDSQVQESYVEKAESISSAKSVVTVKQARTTLSSFLNYIKTRPKKFWIPICLVITCTLAVASFNVISKQIRNRDIAAARADYRKGNHNKAFNCIKLYAEKGDAQAQSMLGELYDSGSGVKQNFIEADKWFRKSADQGYMNAQNTLCISNFNGDRNIAKNYKEAEIWCLKAAKQGDFGSQYLLGRIYMQGGNGIEKNYKEATRWLQTAAEQGKANSAKTSPQFLLGFIYMMGGNGIEKNNKEGIKWMQKTAEQEGKYAVLAQNILGFTYYEEKNFNESLKWFQKAAEQGDSIGQYFVGGLYFNGDGVAKNYEEAEKWFLKAAAQGHTNANKAISLIAQVRSEQAEKSRYSKSSGSGYNSGGSGGYSVTDNNGKETRGYVGGDGYGRDSSGNRSYVDSSGRNFGSYNPNTGKANVGHIGSDGTISATDSSGRSYSGIVDSSGKILMQRSDGYSFGGNVNLD